MLLIVPPKLLDYDMLEENIRPEEVDELIASHGQGVNAVLDELSYQSEEVYSVFDNDVLLGMTGVVPYSLLSDKASPWLLTTTEMPKHPRYLMRGTKQILSRWSSQYSVLENFIDARYKASLRWAKWAGFTIHPAQPYGWAGLPFHRIEIRSK